MIAGTYAIGGDNVTWGGELCQPGTAGNIRGSGLTDMSNLSPPRLRFLLASRPSELVRPVALTRTRSTSARSLALFLHGFRHVDGLGGRVAFGEREVVFFGEHVDECGYA